MPLSSLINLFDASYSPLAGLLSGMHTTPVQITKNIFVQFEAGSAPGAGVHIERLGVGAERHISIRPNGLEASRWFTIEADLPTEIMRSGSTFILSVEGYADVSTDVLPVIRIGQDDGRYKDVSGAEFELSPSTGGHSVPISLHETADATWIRLLLFIHSRNTNISLFALNGTLITRPTRVERLINEKNRIRKTAQSLNLHREVQLEPSLLQGGKILKSYDEVTEGVAFAFGDHIGSTAIVEPQGSYLSIDLSRYGTSTWKTIEFTCPIEGGIKLGKVVLRTALSGPGRPLQIDSVVLRLFKGDDKTAVDLPLSPPSVQDIEATQSFEYDVAEDVSNADIAKLIVFFPTTFEKTTVSSISVEFWTT